MATESLTILCITKGNRVSCLHYWAIKANFASERLIFGTFERSEGGTSYNGPNVFSSRQI